MATVPRVVVVTRPSEYELLTSRHGTRAQAAFFLTSRGQTIDAVSARHVRFEKALQHTMAVIPTRWRRNHVRRRELDRFLFEPRDTVVVLGQDGLVANVAKYLDGQTVVGINPDPDEYEGVLVSFPPDGAADTIRAAVEGRAALEERTMAAAVLDDGQRLVSLNEIFIGHQSHQTARYRIRTSAGVERQMSSGIIVSTGTGATGWVRSIQRQTKTPLAMPAPTDGNLVFFVREAFPSVASDTGITEGLLREKETLTVISEMNEGGVIFGDGIEEDRIQFDWGMAVSVRVARKKLMLARF